MSKLLPAAAIVISCSCFLFAGADSPGTASLREGEDLYQRGLVAEALVKFEEAIAQGAAGGELFYRTGYCHGIAGDKAKGRDYMTKAVPLLEESASKPSAGPAPHCYLSAIYTRELGDPAKGQAAARRGTSLVDSGAFARRDDRESLLLVGRLYSLAGEADKAIGWYEKALSAGGRAEEQAARLDLSQHLAALEELAAAASLKADHKAAAAWMSRQLRLQPQLDRLRHSTGVAMVRAGLYGDAIETFKHFTELEMATESTYLVRVLEKHSKLEVPGSCANPALMDDVALDAAIMQAAKALHGVREKEGPAPAGPKDYVEESNPTLEYVWITNSSGKKIRVLKRPPEPEPGRDVQEPEADSASPASGKARPVAPPPAPPKLSPERLAAEGQFYGLMVEKLRRGQLLGEYSLTRGLSALIFR